MYTLTYPSRQLADTHRLAQALAPELQLGDILLLRGDLGGGKTSFVKALVAALGSEAEVASPTYAIAHFYPLPQGRFLHIDAYRLSGPAEFRDLGLEDYLFDCITAIEWGDIVQADFQQAMTLDFNPLPPDFSLREIKLAAPTAKIEGILQSVEKRLKL